MTKIELLTLPAEFSSDNRSATRLLLGKHVNVLGLKSGEVRWVSLKLGWRRRKVRG